jgi:hypothetical protein
MAVDSVERCDLVAETPTRAGASDSPRPPMFNDGVEMLINRPSVKSSTLLLTSALLRSYAEEATANRQQLGMPSCW